MKLKALAVVMAMGIMAPSLGLAAGNHTMAGCGLGYVLFGHQDNSQVMQILAATTNGTSGNQTFGMTTGTSGCTEDGAVKFVKEAEVFAEVNLDTLRQEMAAGKGEFVTAFAALVGATPETLPGYLAMFQDQYEVLFPASNTTSGEMLTSLKELLESPRA